MTSSHTMRVFLDRDTVRLVAVCHEPDGAKCRVICAADDPCEDWELVDHEHGVKPVDYCNAAEYLAGDGWVEERCEAQDGKPFPDEIPLYDGMPIEVEWNGADYVWRPIKVLAATP